MKNLFKLTFVALAAMVLAVGCNNDGAPKGEGKPFEELPAVDGSDVLAFFKALPQDVLPDMIKPAEARESFFAKYNLMKKEGALADGEGPNFLGVTTDNSVYWSDFLDERFNYDPDEPEGTPHPYAGLYVYSTVKEGTLFGVLKSGRYVSGEDEKDPDKYYLFERESGKIKPTELPIEPAYTSEDLTEDVIITFGDPGLFYAVTGKKFIDSYYDKGMEVLIENIGITGVQYDWNGVSFVRNKEKKVPCIYNFGFGNFGLESNVPYEVPGYSTSVVSSDGLETIFYLTKNGESSPTLVFHTYDGSEIYEIEVCSDHYCNLYGIYPGMEVEEFYKIVEKINGTYDDPSYISIDGDAGEFAIIYAGFDEDFMYMVPKDQYLGDEKFAPGARIARIAVLNAVG